MLGVDLPLPVPLHGSDLLLLGPELLLQLEQLLLYLPVFLLDLDDVLLECGPFVIQDGLRLLDLLHVVVHLALEVVLQERQQVVLDVDLLDLVVNGLKLTVDLAILGQFAEAAELATHLGQLELLLAGPILLALLLDFLQDLRLDQIELEVDLEQASILLDQEAQDVARLLS